MWISAKIIGLNLPTLSPSGQPAVDEKFERLLVESERVPRERMQILRAQSGGSEEVLERLLLRELSLTETQLAALKAFAHGWHFVNLDIETPGSEVIHLLPQAVAETQGALVFRREGDLVHIALLHPERGAFSRLLQKKFPGGIRYALASKQALRNTLAKEDIDFDERFAALLVRAGGGSGEGAEEPVIGIVDMLLTHAIRAGASDIHIEPQEKDAVVRERIDGLLRTSVRIPKDVHARIILRIKVTAGLATDEHAIPQDGKLSHRSEGGRVDVRISIVPTTRGERMVLRLLAASDQVIPLQSLGLSPTDSATLQNEMKRSWGMILVTGPTGSGKTTTLYTVMRQLESDEINISTIEDPVEYDLPGANQIQVNEKAGLTFATGLRSLVRQDPNIILVGEIRDRETAGIAVNSAMTGHLVLSTLHTNDAPTAIPRLIDMGIEPFLIASTVNVIIAQRLVRKICMRCRESIDQKPEALAALYPPGILDQLQKEKGTIRLYQGKGCNLCSRSGFRGRIGIYEIVPIDDALRALILRSAGADQIRQAVKERGWKTMQDDGIAKVLQGVTTIADVLRVIRS